MTTLLVMLLFSLVVVWRGYRKWRAHCRAFYAGLVRNRLVEMHERKDAA